MQTVDDAERRLLARLDASHLSGFHLKTWLVAGMGFFTDAYDLFIIGIALALLSPIWHLTALDLSLLGSTSLIAAAIGSALFGRLADRLGRKRIYGFELAVLATGAIASALAPNLIWLVAFRFILGLGVGGDYPVSATIMSEYANRKDRGKLITLVFAMQGLGLIAGPLVALLLLTSGINHDLAWRTMLGLGALPALATFYLRRQIPETPRYMLAINGDTVAAARAIAAATGATDLLPSHAVAPAPRRDRGRAALRLLLSSHRYMLWLLGTGGAWLLLDFAYYGTTISTPIVLRSLNTHPDLVRDTIASLLIFTIAALPGYIIAALTIDRLGRRTIQMLGFAMITLSYGVIALVPAVTHYTTIFLLVYGVTYLFTEFGPNTTTFVYPAELYPVSVRTTGHGFSAAAGKVGAFAGAFLFPIVLHSAHLPAAMALAALTSLAGLGITALILPEPARRSLEEIAPDTIQPAKRPRPVPKKSTTLA